MQMPADPGGSSVLPGLTESKGADIRMRDHRRGPPRIALDAGSSCVELGVAVLDAPEPQHCHLSLIIVVNTAIVGLVATAALSALEIATHLLT